MNHISMIHALCIGRSVILDFDRNKAIETGIHNIIDRPSGSFNFCKKTKVSDFGTSERFLINSLKLSA